MYQLPVKAFKKMFGQTKGGNLSYVVMHNIIRANQKTLFVKASHNLFQAFCPYVDWKDPTGKMHECKTTPISRNCI